MIWNLIGSIGGKVLDIVDDVVEDKDEANRLKFQIQKQLIENKSNELRAAGLSLDENLATNLMYGAAICRLCYYRKPDALPEAGDIEAQAAFWKQHYNTPLGKGTVSKYVYEVGQVLKEIVAKSG